MLIALVAAGCRSLTTPHPFKHDIKRDAGVAPSPAQAWTPPADAVPPVPPKVETTLPAGVTADTPVTLAQIVDIALANNPATRQAWLAARAAQANLGSAQSAYYPEIDLNASLTRTQSTSLNSVSRQTTFAPSLSLSYLLFDFGGREATVEGARQTLIASDYLHNQALQDVVLRVEEAYYSYLDLKALLSAQEATIKERQTQLDAANARHDAGVATIADVLQAKTAYSQAELTRESIEGNLRTIEGSLATSMGLSATTHFNLGSLPLDIPSQQVSQHVEDLISQATSTRPDLAAARAEAERARVHIREVQAGYMPSLSLTSTLGRSFYSGGFQATPYSAGVSLRFPLFTGGRNTYDVRAAELESQIAVENVRSVEQNVNLQVWTSYFNLQTATRRLGTARDLLASAQESADVAQSRYRAGVGSILDLLTAESALENARAQEVQARADWFVAVAQLAHDTGSLR
jgi:TolC family type I secretion outer membrane protein